MPAPMPPGSTSPSCICISATRTPIGVKLSWLESANRGEAVMARVDRARARAVRGRLEHGGVVRSEPDLLAFHVAAGLRGCVGLVDSDISQRGVALLLRVDGDECEGHQEDAHGRPDGESLPDVAHHLPERDAEGERDEQLEKKLELV